MKRILNALLLFVTVVFVANLFLRNNSSTDTSTERSVSTAASAQPHNPATAERMETLMPSTQRDFLSAIDAARQEYAKGANDMQKGASRVHRAAAICARMHSTAAVGWIGTIYKLSSNGEGKGVMVLGIGHDAWVHTWNNALSDLLDHTLIEPGSKVFADASPLSQGTLVRFDGTFLPNSTDCVEETSLSMEGSISQPEFIIRFTSIAAVTDEPSSSAAAPSSVTPEPTQPATHTAPEPTQPSPHTTPAQPSMEQTALNFVAQYAHAWSDENTTAMTHFDADYADQIDFYGKPISHAALMDMKRKYAERWPTRKFSFRPGTLSATCDQATAICMVSALADWDYSSSIRSARSTGVAQLTLKVVVRPSDTKIVGEYGSVISRQAG